MAERKEGYIFDDFKRIFSYRSDKRKIYAKNFKYPSKNEVGK